MKYLIISLVKGNRRIVDQISDLDSVRWVIEDDNVDDLTFLEGMDKDKFMNEVHLTNLYDDGSYLIETRDKLELYQVKTKISFGYIYNGVDRTTKLIKEYEIVVDDSI